ncbi:DUF1642 domain-containing protein [Pediococcus pentosaceus]|uniref:DUF1642 domain-containing protein n=1 Tax=Pediococcus pentosaceus TaxID=1255 RepID=UPI0011B4EC88|nr:DUF1642 domain-containing protein [Pediococcus pentosaceus]QDZ69420.1 DUF1642 domain-containing protein [Pediococcus pentosaceus]
MAKEELKLQLMKWHNKMSAKFGFDMEDTSEFSELMKQLDEPKKVVIPEFIANDIKYHKKHGSTLRDVLGRTFDQNVESDVYCWFFADDGDENIRKYISAWDNGYEVEKEKKHYVKICDGYSGYLNIDNFTSKMSVANMSEENRFKTKFTDKEIGQLKQRDDIPLDWNKVTFEEAEDE